jgi:hypothetical protein
VIGVPSHNTIDVARALDGRETAFPEQPRIEDRRKGPAILESRRLTGATATSGR